MEIITNLIEYLFNIIYASNLPTVHIPNGSPLFFNLVDVRLLQSAQNCIATLYCPLISLVLDNLAELESAAKTDPTNLSPTVQTSVVSSNGQPKTCRM